MAYSAPSIGAQGLSVPSYTDIQQYLLAQYVSIYGTTVYLGTDSADYQMISAFAAMANDVLGAGIIAYNSRSPLTAVGSGLDSVVKINGIARKPASYSTCVVTLVGTPGTQIVDGVVRDVNNNVWDLPTLVVIPSSGTIATTVTCEVSGAINAQIGQINAIATPTAGWISVTNTTPAVAALPVETDSLLRARQALSVATPSRTMLAATVGGIAAVTGVTRYNVLENPTGSVDSFGNPAHSISSVVEGGTDADVAFAIYRYRGIGCFTNGTTTVLVADPVTGYQLLIGFFRPTYVPIYVTVSIHAIAGVTTATQAAIQADIVTYLNSLQIGSSVLWSELIGATLQARSNPGKPAFSVRTLTFGTAVNPTASNDLALSYTQAAQGISAIVTVNLV